MYSGASYRVMLRRMSPSLRQRRPSAASAPVPQALPPPVYTEYPLQRCPHLRDATTLDQAPEDSAVVLLYRGSALCGANVPSSAEGVRSPQQLAEQAIPADDSDHTKPMTDFYGAVNATGVADTADCSLAPCQVNAAQQAGLQPQLPAVFLGLSARGVAWIAAEVTDPEAAMRAYQRAEAGDLAESAADSNASDTSVANQRSDARLRWVNVRKEGASLRSDDSAIAATAVGMIAWHQANRFSSLSGAATSVESGGWAVRGIHSVDRCVAVHLPLVVV